MQSMTSHKPTYEDRRLPRKVEYDLRMTTEHFDRRGATYDADQIHRRIVDILVSKAQLKPRTRVLDLATGTGAVAIQAAQVVGTQGSVLGVDISEGMLAEARRKSASAGLLNVEFLKADVEHVNLLPADYDSVLLGSALVLMRDIPGMLRRCIQWLAPGGRIGFDMPAKPFGLSQWVAEAAAKQGIRLDYDSVADTPAKCRELLECAGFTDVCAERTVVSDDSVSMRDAISFMDQRIDHPAWRALKDAAPQRRQAVRSIYVSTLERNATEGMVPNTVALNFTYGTKA
jgi:ubiquinone/menaquinone biosynthesis C-methylase UbiE